MARSNPRACSARTRSRASDSGIFHQEHAAGDAARLRRFGQHSIKSICGAIVSGRDHRALTQPQTSNLMKCG